MTTKPWDRPKPKSSRKTKLSPASLAWARARAKKAGRRYPNLVDNLAASARQHEQEHRGNDRGHP